MQQSNIESLSHLKLIVKAFDIIHEGIMITDKKKKIILVNKGFETITGYSASDVAGKDPKVVSSGWHDRTFYQAMWKSVSQNDMWQGEIHDRRKNGEIYVQFLTIIAIKDEKGTLTNYIGIYNDITEKHEALQKIDKLTHTDNLTNLPNRKSLMIKLSNAIRFANQNHLKLGLLLFDMDNFKKINDSAGHKVGDLLLVQVVKRIKPITENVGTMARLGADTFAIVFEKLNQIEGMVYYAQQLMALFEQSFIIESQEFYVSASIGMCFYPDDSQTAEEMIQFADVAMNRAKDLGKKRFELYTQAQSETIKNIISIENSLRKAIENNQLTIYYQPQVEILSGKITGCEALLRWYRPDKGFTPPDIFIPIAEESGLIGIIEEWLLRETARQIKRWQNCGYNLLMSVNISNYRFKIKDFVESTRNIIESEHAKCEWFELELTERIVMDHKEVSDKLNYLKQLGFQIALDDFGTGYSSLAYLKKFNIDKLKIDKSFIQDLPDDAQSCDIVRAVVSLADALNMVSIAEGPETKSQLDFLASLDCKAYQGYYFSKPVPVEQFDKLLQ
jgi:diguanylate cyclase (GGDEF)-like protein/PAS domain S-box-containing protein